MTDDDALLQRYVAGETLADAEQRRLAAALRRDPALRQRLRSGLTAEARLVRAVRSLPRVQPRRRPIPWWRSARLLLPVAAAIVVSGGLLVLVWSGPEAVTSPAAPQATTSSPVQPAAQAPVDPDGRQRDVVKAHGRFALANSPGRLVLPDLSRVDFEVGSTGTVTGRAMDLVSGGLDLRMDPQGEEMRIEAGSATITACGDVAVRYLEVPAGNEPAIQINVAAGRARIDYAGAQHELKRGESRALVPDRRVTAMVVDRDAHHVELQAGGGRDRMRWTLSHQAPPPMQTRERPIAFAALQRGWKVRVELDAEAHMPVAIEVPMQSIQATVVSWEPAGRNLVVERERLGELDPLCLDAAVAETPEVGRKYRLTFDPLDRTVTRLAPAEPAHRRPEQVLVHPPDKHP